MQTFLITQKSLKEALQVIWDSLPQGPTNKAVKSLTLWLKTCTKADGEQFKHTKWLKHQNLVKLCCYSDSVLLCFGANVFQRAKIA